MTDDAEVDGNAAAPRDDEGWPPDDEASEVDLTKALYVAIVCACAVVVLILLRWRLKRVEMAIGARHPLLTELAEELADPEWHWR